MVCGNNPTKIDGSDKFIPRLSQTLDGWKRHDDPVEKKLPVEVDVAEYLVKLGLMAGALNQTRAVGDLVMMAFYYLLRVGEYTSKGYRNDTKQTVEFRAEHVTFFGKDSKGKLVQLSLGEPDEVIMAAESTTLMLENQKNGWHGVCVNHEHNGDEIFSPTRAIGRRICHLRKHGGKGWKKLTLSTVFQESGKKRKVTDNDIRVALKTAAAALDYPSRGFPIERIDTHSLRCGGANALSLAGYSDTQIQKMGRWRGETFKEYVREQLHTFSEGMSRSMKKMFGFVNVEGGVYHDITSTVVAMAYNTNTSAAQAA